MLRGTKEQHHWVESSKYPAGEMHLDKFFFLRWPQTHDNQCVNLMWLNTVFGRALTNKIQRSYKLESKLAWNRHGVNTAIILLAQCLRYLY